MKRTLLLFAILASTLAVQPAKADTFSISFACTFIVSGQPFCSGSGIVGGYESSPGIFTITTIISGSVTVRSLEQAGQLGTSDLAVLPPDIPGAENNKLLYPSADSQDSAFDGQNFNDVGLVFQLADFGLIVLSDQIQDGIVVPTIDVFRYVEQTGGDAELVGTTIDTSVIRLSTATAPEPSTFVLVGTSVLAATGVFRRRFLTAFS
jgi:hypothetical protein